MIAMFVRKQPSEDNRAEQESGICFGREGRAGLVAVTGVELMRHADLRPRSLALLQPTLRAAEHRGRSGLRRLQVGPQSIAIRYLFWEGGEDRVGGGDWSRTSDLALMRRPL